jgi:hypothetical protein
MRPAGLVNGGLVAGFGLGCDKFAWQTPEFCRFQHV